LILAASGARKISRMKVLKTIYKKTASWSAQRCAQRRRSKPKMNWRDIFTRNALNSYGLVFAVQSKSQLIFYGKREHAKTLLLKREWRKRPRDV
jgi:hypothetical protein